MELANRTKMVLFKKGGAMRPRVSRGGYQRSIKCFSEQLGVNPSTVSKLCTNTSQPDLACLLKIADLLEVDIRQLFVKEYKVHFLAKDTK